MNNWKCNLKNTTYYNSIKNTCGGGSCVYVGVGGIWELSVLGFCHEPKTALKNKVYF